MSAANRTYPIDVPNAPSAPNANAAAPAAYSDEVQRRINTLLAENAEYERRRALYRSPREEFESLSMFSPRTTEQSYRLLGLLLGAFPPAAYFIRLARYGLDPWNNGHPLFFLFFAFINAVCLFVGMGMGKVVGKKMRQLERASWLKMISYSSLLALFWAFVTGFAGTAVVFIVGGFVGVVFALPVALAAFPIFAAIHRLMERGHLIEQKHLAPIAYGISLTISAFILGYY
jgi:hypothetical protein